MYNGGGEDGGERGVGAGQEAYLCHTVRKAGGVGGRGKEPVLSLTRMVSLHQVVRRLIGFHH